MTAGCPWRRRRANPGIHDGLVVPCGEKGVAEDLGARWDRDRKVGYAGAGIQPGFVRVRLAMAGAFPEATWGQVKARPLPKPAQRKGCLLMDSPVIYAAALVTSCAVYVVARRSWSSHRRAITGLAVGLLSPLLMQAACLVLLLGGFLLMGQIGDLSNIYYYPSRLFRDALGAWFGARSMSGPGDLMTNPMSFSAIFYGVLGCIVGHVLDRWKKYAPESGNS